MKVRILSLLTLVILGFAAQVFAQERIIDQKEFNDTYDVASKIPNNLVYRSTNRIESSFRKGQIKSSFVKVYESVPPDREHTFLTAISGSALRRREYTQKIESIRIGNKQWNRENDGVWKPSVKLVIRSNSELAQTAREVERTSECKVNSEAKLGGKTTTNYQCIETAKWQTAKGIFEEFTKRNFWVNKERLLIRSDNENKNALTDTSNKSSTVWEFPTDIKIEPPVIYKH